MSTVDEVFDVAPGVVVDVRVVSGDVTVTGGEEGRLVVRVDRDSRDDFDIDHRGNMVTVHLRKGWRRRSSGGGVAVVIPSGTDLRVNSASGDIFVGVDVAHALANTASGDIRMESVSGAASIKSASGDIRLDTVGDRLDVSTASGDVRLGELRGPTVITTASGDVAIEQADDSLTLRSASGRFDVGVFDGSDFKAKSLSGGVRVGVLPRRRLDVDINTLSGRLTNQLPEGDGSPPERTISLAVNTVSGNVTLRGASG